MMSTPVIHFPIERCRIAPGSVCFLVNRVEMTALPGREPPAPRRHLQPIVPPDFAPSRERIVEQSA
jgi:hypothetical protein